MNDPFDLLQDTNSLTIIGDIKRNRDVNIFITSWLHIEKNEPEMFTTNKIYGKYRTGNDFFQI